MAIFKKYWLFLILIVLISYGQILFMYVWKDDNALFFKFYHIKEAVGFFGPGLVGANLYRFLVFPHWVIFSLFGDKQIWPYYFQALLFYMAATVCVYRLFAHLFSERVGRLTGFLFAAGYVASEGFLWLNESIVHSLSIILVCTTLACYFRFASSRKFLFYSLSVVCFFLTLFLTQARVHYFIALVLLFDLLWVVKDQLSLTSLKFFVLRSLPFLIIFYWFYLRSVDTRTKALVEYLQNLLTGNFYVLSSFLGTIGNLIVPDRLQNQAISLLHLQLQHQGVWLASEFGLVLIVVVANYSCTKKSKVRNMLIIGYLALSVAWIFMSRTISLSPKISPSIEGVSSVFLGGLGLLTILFYWLIVSKELRRNLFFLTSWLLMSLIGYIAYNPLGIYASTERYLAHSFVAVVGILALTIFYKKTKVAAVVVIIWGVLNIFNSYSYQHWILANRSAPARDFYKQLKTEMPVLNKGDIIYINISPKALFDYEAAFSVGSMPETTAIAWRYGLDRYDFSLVNTFSDLVKLLKDQPSSVDRVHSFFYSTHGLVDTTLYTRKSLNTASSQTSILVSAIKPPQQEFFDIPLATYIPSAVPLEIEINLAAVPVFQEKQSVNGSIFSKDSVLRSLALEYQIEKKMQLKEAGYTASSQWQDRIIANIHDSDSTTAWEADRILWQKGKEWVQVDLGSQKEVNRIVWLNGFSNNSPTAYTIEASNDGVIWQEVQKVNQIIRIVADDPQVVEFPTQTAQYVRMVMTKTISDDAPALSEYWVVPTKFEKLEIKATEQFLKDPYIAISDKDSFDQMLQATELKGGVNLYWQVDNENSWISAVKSSFQVIYDGAEYKYKTIIPAGGSEITKLRLGDIQIPGDLKITGIKVRPLSLPDVQE